MTALPKQKLIFSISRFKNCFIFNHIPTQKLAPKSPKKCKRGPKCDWIKNKKIGLYFQNQRWLFTYVGTNKVFEPDPLTKNSSERVPKVQKGPNCGRIKNKKMGLYFHAINHAIQVFFKVSFLGFVDAPDMCILLKWYTFITVIAFNYSDKNWSQWQIYIPRNNFSLQWFQWLHWFCQND